MFLLNHLMARSDGADGCNAARAILCVATDRCYCFCLHCALLKLLCNIVNMHCCFTPRHPTPLRCPGKGCGTAPLGAAPQPRVLPVSPPVCKWLGLILGFNTWPVPSHPYKQGLYSSALTCAALLQQSQPVEWRGNLMWSFGVVLSGIPSGAAGLWPKTRFWLCHLCLPSGT